MLIDTPSERLHTIYVDIGAYTDTGEGLADLRLHREVEQAVDKLCAMTKALTGHAKTGRSLIDRVSGEDIVEGIYLDPDDKLIDALDEMSSRYQEWLSTMTAKKSCIDTDGRLSASHCDMLHTSYDDTLEAIACVIVVAQMMRSAIIGHDLAAEPRNGKVFETTESLNRYLSA